MYPYQVTASGGVNEHTGPGVSFPVTGAALGGALGWVTCQHAGSKTGTSSVWDKLRDGHWVPDYYPGHPQQDDVHRVRATLLTRPGHLPELRPLASPALRL